MMFRRLVSLIPYSLSLRAMRHFAIPVFVIVAALAIRVGYAAWVEPAVGPTGGTPPPPINTSGFVQTKTGGLNIATVSGSVGIGTTSPGGKVEIRHDATSALPTLLLYNTDSTFAAFFDPLLRVFSSYPSISPGKRLEIFSFGAIAQYDSAEVMKNFISPMSNSYITAGNVGIGTTTPGDLLHINNPSGVAALRMSAAGTAMRLVQHNAFDGLSIEDGSSNSRVLIKATGNVGIGTTGPAYKLDVSGGMRATYLQDNSAGWYVDADVTSRMNNIDLWGNLWQSGTPYYIDIDVGGYLGGSYTFTGNVATGGQLSVGGGKIYMANNDPSGFDTAGIQTWNTISLYSSCCGYMSAANYGILLSPRDGSGWFKGPIYEMSGNRVCTAANGLCGGGGGLSGVAVTTAVASIGIGINSVTVSCPAGYVATGGGHFGNSTFDYQYYDDRPSGSSSWVCGRTQNTVSSSCYVKCITWW